MSGAGGFFRGDELTRLLLLAAVALAGWGLVWYFFVPRAVAPAAKAQLAAEVKPLPPADPAPELRDLKDKTPIESLDTPAYRLLLERVRERPGDLAKEARGDIQFRQVMTNPARFRGLPVTFWGTAKTVVVHDEPASDLFPSGRFYEAYAITPDSAGNPLILVFDEAPPKLQAGDNIHQQIAFEGYFLKLVAYRGARVRWYYAPMFIGRITAAVDESARESQESDQTRFWMFVALGVMATFTAVRIVVGLRRWFKRDAITVRLTPTEEIAPDDLREWVESKSDGDSASDSGEEG